MRTRHHVSGLIVIGLAGQDLVGPEDLLHQDHASELVRQGHRAERELEVAALELEALGPADDEADVPPLLTPLLEPAAEAQRVVGLALRREEDDVGPVRDPRRHLLVLAHLGDLHAREPREELVVVRHVVHIRRTQPTDGDHGDTHARGLAILGRVPEEENGEERHFNIHTDPETMAGHYANFTNVSHSDYEFTITFARVDHEVDEGEVPGVVVSRVNLSPRFMRELIDAMEDNFSKWQTREGIRDLPEFDEPDNSTSS